MKLYHITPGRNIEAALTFVVDPAFSQGAYQRSWWVTAENVEWALAHVSARHRIEVQGLAVCMINVRPDDEFNKTRWQGVYTSKHPKRADRVVNALWWMERDTAHPNLEQQASDDIHR